VTVALVMLARADAADDAGSGSVPADTVRPVCRVEGISEPLRCHRVQVRERHGDSASRLLELEVMVLPALGSDPRPDPLLLLQGGPGVAGLPMARRFAGRHELRKDRDLVFVDQRGTGRSGRLSCEAPGRLFFGTLLPADHLRACRARFAGRADFSQYTSTASAHDLEAIRRALGYATLNVWGFSFGTRVAMAYARTYPASVRTLVLDGVVPFDATLAADLAQSLERAITFVTDRCTRDAACRAAYGDVAQALTALAVRLDSEPAPVRIAGADSVPRDVVVGRWELAYAIRGMLYGPAAAAIPAAVHRATSSGDLAEFARIYAGRSAWPGDETGLGAHLGPYCSEDLPFASSAEALERARGTLMGALYYEQYRAGCGVWPMPAVSPQDREPLRSAVPALLLSGQRDPVTPPAYGERAVKHLARGRHLVIPGAGHAEPSPCKASIVATFLDAASAAGLDVGCLSAMRFPAFEIVRH
jgi:pimeloyl-ACP methyl ester carboxylesterase